MTTPDSVGGAFSDGVFHGRKWLAAVRFERPLYVLGGHSFGAGESSRATLRHYRGCLIVDCSLGYPAVDVPYYDRGGGLALWRNLLRTAAGGQHHHLEISF
jgi:hypothetical protein